MRSPDTMSRRSWCRRRRWRSPHAGSLPLSPGAGRRARPPSKGWWARPAALAEALKAARYSVFTWNAATLGPRDAASVAESAATAVDLLSSRHPPAVFPLGGRDNITGAHQMALWRFGYPLRTAVGGGVARHVPELYATAAALKDADLLHASSFRPDAPPEFERGPVIALAHPDTVFAREPDAHPRRHAGRGPRRPRLPHGRGGVPAAGRPAPE